METFFDKLCPLQVLPWNYDGKKDLTPLLYGDETPKTKQIPMHEWIRFLFLVSLALQQKEMNATYIRYGSLHDYFIAPIDHFRYVKIQLGIEA